MERVSSGDLLVSILVPMRNEEKWIGRCLDTILENDLPASQYEVLVLDGRSTDRSRAIAEERCRLYPNFYVVENPGKFVPVGLNLGLKHARGRYILIFGAHVEYPPNYVRACVEELNRGSADVVGGALKTMPGAPSSIAQAIALMSQHPFGVGNSRFRISRARSYVDTVPYGAYRRELFEQCGGYREDLLRNQDLELSARFRSHGARILLLPDVTPVYYNVPTFSAFLRQAYGNGLWLGRAWVWYPVSFAWRHSVPVAFVLALLFSLFMAPFLAAALYFVIIAMGLYAALALVSAAQLSLRWGPQYLLLLPPLFFGYHTAYGFGTLAGLLSSRVRRIAPLT